MKQEYAEKYKDGMHFHIDCSYHTRCYELRGIGRAYRFTDVLQPVEIEREEEGSEPNLKPVEPFLMLQRQDVQNLMDELWRCGIRPGCGEGNIGELSATKYHLEDMRLLALGKIDK